MYGAGRDRRGSPCRRNSEDRVLHGVGMDPNIVMASLEATLTAVMRLMRREWRV